MKIYLIAAALASTSVGGIAYAMDITPPAPTKPVRGDTNNDGKISRAEYVAGATARFAELDADKDGNLTREEMRAGHKGRRGGKQAMGGPFQPVQDGDMKAQRKGGRDRGMARVDTDGDGKISRTEHDAMSAKRFQRMDTNGDGTVDKTEMAAGRGGGRGAARIDTNGDGALTRAEYDAMSAKTFARMDKNGDGFIDASERPARGNRNAAPATPAPSSPQTPSGA